ncbi:MAG: hypothetical protein ACLFU8_04420 [Anaerolineales bacterium]
MSERLALTVLTPVETLLEASDVQRIRVELADNLPLVIYPGHAPLVAETIAGPLEYANEAGVLKILSGEVTLFTPGSGALQLPEVEEEVEEAERFDRLARALMESLSADPEEVVAGADDEEEG